MADFALSESPKLISRKIRVVEKFKYYVHTVNVLNYFIFQKNRAYVFLWIIWSIIYVCITTGCGIYELTLGGKLIEVTLVPFVYLVILICWTYCIVCIWAYLKTMVVHDTTDGNDAEKLVTRLHESFKARKDATLTRFGTRSSTRTTSTIWDSPATIHKVKRQEKNKMELVSLKNDVKNDICDPEVGQNLASTDHLLTKMKVRNVTTL